MKRTFCMLVTFVLLWAAPAFAQLSGTRFDIPFNFQVGRQMLPAGEYHFAAVGEKALLIRQVEGQQAMVTMTAAPAESATTGGRARLVFNRYGDRYFLSAAWLNSSSARQLSKSVEETKYAGRVQAATEVIYAKLH